MRHLTRPNNRCHTALCIRFFGEANFLAPNQKANASSRLVGFRLHYCQSGSSVRCRSIGAAVCMYNVLDPAFHNVDTFEARPRTRWLSSVAI